MKVLTKQTATLGAWQAAMYPFDRANCGTCLTLHAYGFCSDPSHQKLTADVEKVWIRGYISTKRLRFAFAALLRLRRKYAHLWLTNPPERKR